MTRFRTIAVIAAAIALAFATAGVSAQAADTGVLVSAVTPESPAARAGIARGDVLLSVDGKDVSTPRDVVLAVSGRKGGEAVEVRLVHGDVTRTVTVTLEDRSGRPWAGLTLAPSIARGQESPGVGAMISEVSPDSPAARAGLRPRDVVLSVDGTGLDQELSLTDLVSRHKPGDTVTLSVWSRNAEARDVTVTLGESPSSSGSAYLGVRYGMVSSRGDRQRPRAFMQGRADGEAPPVSS